MYKGVLVQQMEKVCSYMNPQHNEKNYVQIYARLQQTLFLVDLRLLTFP